MHHWTSKWAGPFGDIGSMWQLITEVKQPWIQLVQGWVTHQRTPLVTAGLNRSVYPIHLYRFEIEKVGE